MGFHPCVYTQNTQFFQENQIMDENVHALGSTNRHTRSVFLTIYLPFLESFASHTPRNGIRCLTSCKIIILGDKLIPK